MAFPFVIRKLRKLLGNEQTIAARGADRFAPGRIKEITKAIEVLSAHSEVQKAEKKVTRRIEHKRMITLKELINQIPLNF